METHSLASTASIAAAPMLASPAPSDARIVMSCRCAGCGSAVAFDALIVTCDCADDGRSTDSTLH